MKDPSVSFTEKIAAVLDHLGVPTALIGAAAMAVHGYVRSTGDTDLGTAVDPYRVLVPTARALQAQGLVAEVRSPDDDDPLGGVIRLQGENGIGLDIVNFRTPSSRGATGLMEEALREAVPLEPGSALRVVPIPHLVALKLYAGDLDSQRDVARLLDANPRLDLAELRAFLDRFGLAAQLDPALGFRRR